jgi:hypothetical protein
VFLSGAQLAPRLMPAEVRAESQRLARTDGHPSSKQASSQQFDHNNNNNNNNKWLAPSCANVIHWSRSMQ